MPKGRLDITIDWGYTTNIVVGVEYLFEKSLEHKKDMPLSLWCEPSDLDGTEEHEN